MHSGGGSFGIPEAQAFDNGAVFLKGAFHRPLAAQNIHSHRKESLPNTPRNVVDKRIRISIEKKIVKRFVRGLNPATGV